MEALLNVLRSGYFYTIIIITLVLALAAILIGKKVKKLKINDKPSKFMTLIIVFIDFLNNYTKKSVGSYYKVIAPHILTMGILIFFFNISGLFALPVPTSYVVVTFSFAMYAFLLIQYSGIRNRKFRHFSNYLGAVKFMAPITLPINILSDLTPLISMTLRLFGNIVASVILTGLIYAMAGWVAFLFTPPVHLIFDLGFGLIQTIVFVVLTMIFVSNKIDVNEIIIN